MARSFLLPRRQTEATAEQLVVTGAWSGAGIDPIDGDVGFNPLGRGTRDIPRWTLDKARAYSVASYRANPMARAIVDTYSSFCVGDSGMTLQVIDPSVRPYAEDFWFDPKAPIDRLSELMFRDHLLMGESAFEMMVGETTGVTRWSPIDPTRITGVELQDGNPLWPASIHIRNPAGDPLQKTVVQYDDLAGRSHGDVMWWTSWKALLTDTRGYPFLGPVLDWLDTYDQILSNLADRTALARYLVWDVTVEGDDAAIKAYIDGRGGLHAPKSGALEVHNKGVEWKPQTAQSGAFEDTQTASAFLTQVAAGSGLAKTYLAEPEHANRATSVTMAEPVRRRMGGVQNMWLANMTMFCRFNIDQAVAAGMLPATISIPGEGGTTREVPTAHAVSVTGPEIASSDAQVTAGVLLNLAQAIQIFEANGILTAEAAKVATKKAWEDFVGVPYSPELDRVDGDIGNTTDYVDQTQSQVESHRRPHRNRLARLA